jgi:uncharacterized tellurite resistance protein B-like protein
MHAPGPGGVSRCVGERRVHELAIPPSDGSITRLDGHGGAGMLKEWIARQFGTASSGTSTGSAGSLNLAVAALLVEVLRADYEVSQAEREQVVRSIGKLLDLGEADGAALLDLAERHTEQSHDLFQFTSMINQGYSAAEKERLVEHLWRVARSDETIHKYEEHLIRRIADLLHVPHSSFIAAKLRTGE